MEVWRAVVGFEDFYEVSDLGNVRSLPRERTSYGGRVWITKVRNMKLTEIKGKGYRVVSLHLDEIRQRRYVHDLVLCAFIGPRPSLDSHCCHGVAGVHDNSVGNLQWGSPAVNAQDRHRDGTMQVGENHWKNTYSTGQIKEVKALLGVGDSVRSIFEKTGVAMPTIWAVKANRQWASI